MLLLENFIEKKKIKKKPLNRIDLFFKYKKDYKERSLDIITNGRLKINEF